MFSVDNFYNYLIQHLKAEEKEAAIKSFSTHGSRLLCDIIVPTYQTSNDKPHRYIGQIAMFDQEPIQLQYFRDWINFDPKSYPPNYEYNATGDLYKHLTADEFIFRHFAAVRTPILCHSERGSLEVEQFSKNFFNPVHYFYHGLIARDWFRHWKRYPMMREIGSKRFGMYCRDATGSRHYRLNLLRRLANFKDHLYYNLQDPIYNLDPMLNVHYSSAEQYTSDASAMIVPEDTKKFNIQIVPETLYETSKTHLTEKIFKPIVMRQPFIVVGCPGSLAYLKSYGFLTFEPLWNEIYDDIIDPVSRMDAIFNVIHFISNLSDDDFEYMMIKTEAIVAHNHEHFFSEEFEELMMRELHYNLNNALEAREECYNRMPGGTLFYYLEELMERGLDITDYNRKIIDDIAKYELKNDPRRGRLLMLQYKQLFKHRKDWG